MHHQQWAGAGGAGSANSITGSPVTYAGGGGGGTSAREVPSTPSGGAGGGGAGGGNVLQSTPLQAAVTAGTVNTGGGGGGGGYSTGYGWRKWRIRYSYCKSTISKYFSKLQEQTQLQHYPHQLVVVKLLHSQFLEINNRLIYYFLNLDNFFRSL
jgi:hypothetical protein